MGDIQKIMVAIAFSDYSRGIFNFGVRLARNLDASFYFELFWRQFGPVGLALALLGVLGLLRHPKTLILTCLAFLPFFAFSVVYLVPVVEGFFIPAFLVTSICSLFCHESTCSFKSG